MFDRSVQEGFVNIYIDSKLSKRSTTPFGKIDKQRQPNNREQKIYKDIDVSMTDDRPWQIECLHSYYKDKKRMDVEWLISFVICHKC